MILDEGVLLRMDRGLSNAMVTLLRKGRHNQEERQLVIPALKRNDMVMELGGGIGHMAIRCAKKIGSDRVSTFEGNPQLARIMGENFRLNSVSPTVHFCLLGREEGSAEFHVGEDFWSSSTVRAPYHDFTITVPVRPFNKMVKTLNPTFLLIDIEGGEYELFQYADLETVRKLMVEVHPKVLGTEKVDWILRRISHLGFDLRESIKDCYLFFRR
ncbi:MAG: FkbM family methyltransferase [Thermodesulfobacteriota bacterium]|nr:FkbM family methyltransferase [Thermodesulfobacteriota bacterium]